MDTHPIRLKVGILPERRTGCRIGEGCTRSKWTRNPRSGSGTTRSSRTG